MSKFSEFPTKNEPIVSNNEVKLFIGLLFKFFVQHCDNIYDFLMYNEISEDVFVKFEKEYFK